MARYVELADAAAQDILSREHDARSSSAARGLYMDALIECSVFSGDETDLTLCVRNIEIGWRREQGNRGGTRLPG